MEQNENLRNETSRRKPFIKALVAVLVAALAAFVLLPITNRSVEAAEKVRYASDWAQLRNAITDSQDGDIVEITKDIVASKAKDKNNKEFKTIDLSGEKTVTIRAKDANDGKNYTIWRDANDANFPLFQTSNAKANLILGEGITLSGMTGSCEDDSITEFKVIWSNGSTTEEKTKEQTLAEADFGKDLFGTLGEGWQPGNGYTFDGWKWKDSSGAVNTSTSFQTTFNIPANTNGEAKVVAQWQRNDFKVIWSNGDSSNEKTETWAINDETVTVKPLSTELSFTPPDDWKPGSDYTFTGWK